MFSAVEAARSHPDGTAKPALVAFDRWYSSLENLKLVRGYGWDGLTRLKRNRQVSVQAGQQQAVSALDRPASGLQHGCT